MLVPNSVGILIEIHLICLLAVSHTLRQALRTVRTWAMPWRFCWIWSWSAWRDVWTNPGYLTELFEPTVTAPATWQSRGTQTRASVPANATFLPLYSNNPPCVASASRCSEGSLIFFIIRIHFGLIQWL